MIGITFMTDIISKLPPELNTEIFRNLAAFGTNTASVASTVHSNLAEPHIKQAVKDHDQSYKIISEADNPQGVGDELSVLQHFNQRVAQAKSLISHYYRDLTLRLLYDRVPESLLKDYNQFHEKLTRARKIPAGQPLPSFHKEFAELFQKSLLANVAWYPKALSVLGDLHIEMNDYHQDRKLAVHVEIPELPDARVLQIESEENIDELDVERQFEIYQAWHERFKEEDRLTFRREKAKTDGLSVAELNRLESVRRESLEVEMAASEFFEATDSMEGSYCLEDFNRLMERASSIEDDFYRELALERLNQYVPLIFLESSEKFREKLVQAEKIQKEAVTDEERQNLPRLYDDYDLLMHQRFLYHAPWYRSAEKIVTNFAYRTSQYHFDLGLGSRELLVDTGLFKNFSPLRDLHYAHQPAQERLANFSQVEKVISRSSERSSSEQPNTQRSTARR
jgi:hypothetical protein